MTQEVVPVSAEWAIRGKTLGREGYRVLACSTGVLSTDNFDELFGRFNIGTPDQLPQVSLSYVTTGAHPGRVFNLAMALHRWAADLQPDGDELLKRDDDGRPVAVTTYFCVPYQPPAGAAVSYQDMYRELAKPRLDSKSGPPILVEFPPRTSLPAISTLAMQAASRLLSGKPVCVLGAGATTLDERLAFIESVTQLLPYGFRTRLASATWVRSTHRDHNFRLFFSAERRDTKQQEDHVVYWEQPERTPLVPGDDFAHTYYLWLCDTVNQLDILGKLTEPRSFAKSDVLEALDQLGISQLTPDGHGPDAATRSSAPASRWWRGGRSTADTERILRDCAEHMRTRQLPQLNVAITHLANRKKNSAEERSRYQEIIREEQLFRHVQGLESAEAELRQTLLKVAFKPPLTYSDYCLIDDSRISGDPQGADDSKHELLGLIVGAEMGDTAIRAVVYGQLRERAAASRVEWLRSAHIEPTDLIKTAAGLERRPTDALYACVAAADLISPGSSFDSHSLRQILRDHGYLANLLNAGARGDDKAQVYVLNRFLRAAYPRGLGEVDIHDILVANEHPPSQALLVAVLLRIPPYDTPLARLARDAYVFHMTRAMDLYADTQEELTPRLPLAHSGRNQP